MEKSYTMTLFDLHERGEDVMPVIEAGMDYWLTKITQAVSGFVSTDLCFVIAALEMTAANLRAFCKDDYLQTSLADTIKKHGGVSFESIAIPAQMEAEK